MKPIRTGAVVTMAARPMLDDRALEQSEVVANAAMNRGRRLAGVNSYSRELGFNPLDTLLQCLEKSDTAAWLDLCCGTGQALLQAAEQVKADGLGHRVRLLGVDLVPMFCPAPPGLEFLSLEEASLSEWRPEDRFDLITCVHGLHYVGDKLGLLGRVASWLKPDGLFLGHLDLSNVLVSEKPDNRLLLKELRRAGFEYDGHRHLVVRRGGGDPAFPFRYTGADDAAGPNYTGQPAVHSWYEPLASS